MYPINSGRPDSVVSERRLVLYIYYAACCILKEKYKMYLRVYALTLIRRREILSISLQGINLAVVLYLCLS